jgi:hypothetical protein
VLDHVVEPGLCEPILNLLGPRKATSLILNCVTPFFSHRREAVQMSAFQAFLTFANLALAWLYTEFGADRNAFMSAVARSSEAVQIKLLQSLLEADFVRFRPGDPLYSIFRDMSGLMTKLLSSADDSTLLCVIKLLGVCFEKKKALMRDGSSLMKAHTHHFCDCCPTPTHLFSWWCFENLLPSCY